MGEVGVGGPLGEEHSLDLGCMCWGWEGREGERVGPPHLFSCQIAGSPGECPPTVCISAVPEASGASHQSSPPGSAVAALAHCPPTPTRVPQ